MAAREHTTNAPHRSGAGGQLVAGLMSGTSADGISAALARFETAADGRMGVELVSFLSRPYSAAQRERLLCAIDGASPAEYCRLNFELGGWLADAALELVASANLDARDVRAIATHGHTVWHEPGHSTWQFGEAAVIAERTGIDVVSDFRVRDVAAGGQGAPLVPIADALLFAPHTEWRALQNLGGIGNVTIVPPDGDLERVRAFDTGPGCAVIDGVTRACFPELPYDVDGKLARRGRVIEPVVAEALAHPYFAARPPKSTGRELFSAHYIAHFMEACHAADARAADEDLIATAAALTARSIAMAFERFVPEPIGEVVLSGGGARNPALVAAIRRALSPRPVHLFDELFFDGEAKEAVAFALLGLLHVERRAGNVCGATGARGPRILGKLTPAR
ncbi:MAG TPA: anhydro-N-acetylmuramic acid kinase [Gemmatimonadaceae bacterium]